MLSNEIKITGNYKPHVDRLNFNGVSLKDEKLIFSLSDDSPFIKKGQDLQLFRKDGRRIYYSERLPAATIYPNSKIMEMPDFPQKVLMRDFSIDIRDINVNEIPTETGDTKQAVILYLKNSHGLITNRDDISIKGTIIGGLDSIGRGLQRCNSDIVLASLNQDRYDSISSQNLFFIYDGKNGHVTANTESYYCEGIDNVSIRIKTPNGTEYDAIVPVDANGQDIDNILIVYAQDKADLASVPYFLCPDERFIHHDENGTPVALKNGIWAENANYSFSISLPLAQDFSLKMNRNEDIENYANLIAERNINGVVDYERYQFSPYFRKTIDGELFPATEIEFNLHFRERDVNNKWNVDKNGFWNSYQYNSTSNSLSHKAVNNEYLQDTDADLVGQIGFDDDDVNYQSMALQQSFLRLSFYDTPDRGNQNLLFYNTLFFNTSRLYAKYSKAVAAKTLKDVEYSEYQWASGSPYRLGTTFNTYSKYAASGSSEGFYLYLFKGTLKDEGTSTTIYMKAEFNHSKYGVTVPFILPREKNGTPISPTSKLFPINYYDRENGKIDMTEYNNDVYIPITIQYIKERDEYAWYSPLVQENGKLIFNLYEPRLNPTVREEINGRNDGDLASQKLYYDADNGFMVGETVSIRNIGERQICSKRFLKTVNRMSINGKVVANSSRINFSAASTYEIVYELNTSVVASGAFIDNKDVTSMKFNNGITEIGNSALGNTSLNEVSFGKKVSTIGNYAFCKTRSLGVADMSGCEYLSTIGNGAFQGATGLHEVKFPNHSITIKNGVFSRTAITAVTIPDGTTMGRFVFSHCYHLKDISKFGNNLQLENFNKAFVMEDLGSEKRPYDITNGWGLFADCKGLIAKMNVASNREDGQLKEDEITYLMLYQKFNLKTDGMLTTYEDDKDIQKGGSGKINWLFKSRNGSLR